MRRLEVGSWPPVATGEVLGLAVAVRAQQLQILQFIVVVDAVDVMQSEDEGPVTPSGNPAQLATGLFEAEREQTALEVAAITSPVSSISSDMARDRGTISPRLTAADQEALAKPPNACRHS